MDSYSIDKQYMSSPESTSGSDSIFGRTISEIVSLEEGVENAGLDEELSGIEPMDFNTTIEDEVHRPLSPATPFESFFLSPELQTSQISANALASQIRGASRSNYSGTSLTSVATDEFGTACEQQEDLPNLPTKGILGNLFGKDVLVISREPIPEVSLEYEDASIMSSTSTTPTDQPHYDVAEHVYQGAKGVWAWGKGIPVFKPFMGIAEGFTNKVLSVAGTSLQAIDDIIAPKLADLDNGVLNPAIANLVGILQSTASKGEDTLAPIVQSILSTVGSTKIENKTTEPAPEVTGSTIGRMSYVK